MRSQDTLLRIGSIIVAAGIIALALSVVATAEEGDFPFAFATLGDVQTGSDVQSASGVIKTLHRLMLAEGYSEEEADGLMETVAGMIANGVPPGTILQMSRQLLKEDVTADDLSGALEELKLRLEGEDAEPPGQVVNDILGRGNGKKDDFTSGAVSSANKSNNGKNDADDEDEDGKGKGKDKQKGNGKKD